VAELPAPDRLLRLYVLNSAGQWAQKDMMFEQGFEPRTQAKPFLEYRLARRSDGTFDNTFGGHFMVGWAQVEAPGQMPHVRLSRFVNQTNDLDGTELAFPGRSQDYLWNQWARSVDGGSAALYADSTIDNVFGLWPQDSGVRFLPHADGAPNRSFTVMSDFSIMEDGVCDVLASSRALNCGVFDITD